MAVGIQGYGDAGMTNHLRDYLWVYVPAEQQRGARVPQVVEAHGGEACALAERPKLAIGYIATLERLALLGSESLLGSEY
jgi:hypothetical protein